MFATASVGRYRQGRAVEDRRGEGVGLDAVRIRRVERQPLDARRDRRLAAVGQVDVGRAVRRDVERDADGDVPVRAVDVDALVRLGPRGAGERRDAPAVELEEAARHDVDAACRVAPDRALDPDRLPAEEHPRQVHAVAADVHQRAAACRQDVPDVGRVVVVVGEPALDRLQPADAARRDELADGDPRGMQAIHERLHQQDAGRLGGRDHPLGVGRRQGDRLLAQDVLARPDRGERPLQVEVVRQRDVDGVDPGIREQRLVRIVGARDRRARRPPAGRCRHRATRWPRPRRAAPARGGRRGSTSRARSTRSTARPSAGARRVTVASGSPWKLLRPSERRVLTPPG